MVRRGGFVARLSLMVLFAVLVFPADAWAPLGVLNIALTSSGPSPAVVTMTAIPSVAPEWTNQDQVTHTVVFADGLCSLQLAPGESGYCSSESWQTVGSYPYSVDGTTSGSIVVTKAARSVTLTAKSHTIRRGAHLLLHGTLAYECCGDIPRPEYSDMPVIVLARHDRHHPFRRIAMAAEPGQLQPSGYCWQLSVHPKTNTIYIAQATSDDETWQDATTRPFKVVVRGRS